MRERMEKFVALPETGIIVFVGDTHGDLYASRLVTKNYLRKETTVVFLGDYVDRGRESKENIDFLLEMRKKHDNLILLAGNHELAPVCDCSPSDFWDRLSEEQAAYYREQLPSLPLLAANSRLIALHGALPDILHPEDVNGLQSNDQNWNRIVWGDFREREGEHINDFLGRPKFGRDYFERIMKQWGRTMLFRSHDPLAPQLMFGGRCVTLFTSSAYNLERTIAVVDLSKKIESAADMDIINF